LTGDEKELVVFVPGVVFDLQGHRLGRGRGWYDQLLNRLRPGAIFVGLAYEFQVVEEVPTQPWDEPVHYVITEKRLINCGAALPQSNSLLARHP
jgi:5-formyltetrahydrofolate cyclo-ligase